MAGKNKLVRLLGAVQEFVFELASKQNESINLMPSAPSEDGMLMEAGIHGDCLNF